MISNDLLFKMIYCTEITPPLEIKEIFDFVLCKMPDQNERDRLALELHYRTILENEEKEWEKVDFATKKETNQESKKISAEITEFGERRRAFGVSPFMKALYTEEIDRRVEKKKKLNARYQYLKLNPPNEDRDRAKLVPIDSFLDFTSAGFTSCIFHKKPGEKSVTPSLKYYPSDNHVYCHSCTKRADSIACMMAKENLDFNKAIKRLLNK